MALLVFIMTIYCMCQVRTSLLDPTAGAQNVGFNLHPQPSQGSCLGVGLPNTFIVEKCYNVVAAQCKSESCTGWLVHDPGRSEDKWSKKKKFDLFHREKK